MRQLFAHQCGASPCHTWSMVLRVAQHTTFGCSFVCSFARSLHSLIRVPYYEVPICYLVWRRVREILIFLLLLLLHWHRCVTKCQTNKHNLLPTLTSTSVCMRIQMLVRLCACVCAKVILTFFNRATPTNAKLVINKAHVHFIGFHIK